MKKHSCNNVGHYANLLFSSLKPGYVGLLLALFCNSAVAQPNIVELQNLVQQWVALEQQNTALIVDWGKQQPVLEQRLQILNEEKNQLEEILSNNASTTDDIEERRISLLELQNTMEQDQANLEQVLHDSLNTLSSLHFQLPPPLQLAWQEKLDTLMVNSPSTEEQSNNERLQIILEVLTQLDDFQQRISLHEAPVTLSDGSSVLVKQLYLGASHGWYASTDGSTAAYGRNTDAGWVWESSLSVDGNTVLSAINMLERNVDISLISLPLILSASH